MFPLPSLCSEFCVTLCTFRRVDQSPYISPIICPILSFCSWSSCVFSPCLQFFPVTLLYIYMFLELYNLVLTYPSFLPSFFVISWHLSTCQSLLLNLYIIGLSFTGTLSASAYIFSIPAVSCPSSSFSPLLSIIFFLYSYDHLWCHPLCFQEHILVLATVVFLVLLNHFSITSIHFAIYLSSYIYDNLLLYLSSSYPCIYIWRSPTILSIYLTWYHSICTCPPTILSLHFTVSYNSASTFDHP